MDKFFVNHQGIPFSENQFLKHLSMQLSANQIQTAMTLEGINQPKKPKRRGCCGLF